MSKKRETQHKIVENYKLYEEIGSGQYGKVFRAVDTKTNEVVAVKVIPLEKFANIPKLEEFTANEIKTLGRINNPNVIKFMEMLKTTNNMYLVYEYCEGGTLERHLTKKHHFTEIESLKIFAQLINAFKSLYKENILHRDLKPSNILVHKEVIKIADFGFCKRVMSPQELTLTMVGSPIYMAPEILKGHPYTIKADIWSLGVVLYEILFGICPYEDNTLSGLIEQIDTKDFVILNDINSISINTINLLRRLLVKDYKQRMEWTDLLEYPLQIEELERAALMPNLNLAKIDLEVVNKYNDQGNNQKEDQKKMFNILIKERNKVLFLVDVIYSVLEYNLSLKSPMVAFLFIKKAMALMETIRRDISVENISSKYLTYPQWSSFKFTDQFYGFSSRLNQEFDEASKTLAMFKQEVSAIVNNNPLDNDLNDPNFKVELIDSFTNQKYVRKMILSYAEETNDAANGRFRLGQEDQGVKFLLHAINVLECDNIEEFFEKQIDYTPAIYEQNYFRALFMTGKDKLLEIFSTKVATAKISIL